MTKTFMRKKSGFCDKPGWLNKTSLVPRAKTIWMVKHILLNRPSQKHYFIRWCISQSQCILCMLNVIMLSLRSWTEVIIRLCRKETHWSCVTEIGSSGMFSESDSTPPVVTVSLTALAHSESSWPSGDGRSASARDLGNWGGHWGVDWIR